MATQFVEILDQETYSKRLRSLHCRPRNLLAHLQLAMRETHSKFRGDLQEDACCCLNDWTKPLLFRFRHEHLQNCLDTVCRFAIGYRRVSLDGTFQHSNSQSASKFQPRPFTPELPQSERRATPPGTASASIHCDLLPYPNTPLDLSARPSTIPIFVAVSV